MLRNIIVFMWEHFCYQNSSPGGKLMSRVYNWSGKPKEVWNIYNKGCKVRQNIWKLQIINKTVYQKSYYLVSSNRLRLSWRPSIRESDSSERGKPWWSCTQWAAVRAQLFPIWEEEAVQKLSQNISLHPLDCNSQTVNIYKGFAEEDEPGSMNKVVVMVTDQNSAAVTVTCVIRITHQSCHPGVGVGLQVEQYFI